MRNVSNEYIKTMKNRRDFYAVAEITFQDGTKKTLGKKDFTISGNSVVQSAGSTTFPLGMVVPRTVNICLMNDDDRWSEYDFYGAKIFLRTKYDLDSGLTEPINVGNFTVITPESYGTTIQITATDDSYKLDKDYTTNIRYPTTLLTAVQDSCRTCGVTLFSTVFTNNGYEIQQKPENLTHRQFIGMCAMIAGGNAFFDEYNRLVIQTYDFSEFERTGLDGGYFDKLSGTRYQSGDNADGGSFNPWNTGDVFDGGNFRDMKNIHFLQTFKSGLKIGTDDVVITGVKLTKDKEEWIYGSEGYVLSMENQLAAGKEEETVALIGELIVGLQFRPFTGDSVAYPLADFMDLAILIDRNGNVYKTVITDIDFQYYGFTTLKCSADSPIRNSSKYYGNEVKAIVLARQEAEKEISDYDKTVQDMTAMISQGFGLFFTKELQEDGSYKSYMHDKPTMAESSYIVTSTSNGLLVSNNGGTSWAVDKNGNALFNVITTHGLNAGWIVTGRVSSEDGSVYFDLDKNELACNKMISSPDSKNFRTILDITPGENLLFGGSNTLKLYRDQTAKQMIEIGVYGDGVSTIATMKKLFISVGNMEVYIDMDTDGVAIFGDTGVTGSFYATGNISTDLNVSATGNISAKGTITAINNIESDKMVRADRGFQTQGTLYVNGRSTFIQNMELRDVSGSKPSISVAGNLTVKGTKNRSVKTENYDDRLLYCYEMPSPMFGDIGEGITDESGECIISLDDIFSETIKTNIEYQVFLQKEGPGDLWVSEKNGLYFVVNGTKNLKFAWEIKAKQMEYEYARLERFENDEDAGHVDYESQYMVEVEQLLKEREELIYETA